MLAVWAGARVLEQAVDNRQADIPIGCRSLESSGLD